MRKQLLLLLFYVAVLCFVGGAMICSNPSKSDTALRFRAQLYWIGVGLVILPGLVRIDYARLNHPPVLYALGGVCLIFLVAVFIPGVGTRHSGANRWVCDLGQPSEFTKPVVITLLAAWLARLRGGELKELTRGFLVPLLIGAVPAVLILAEPDWGTAIFLGTLTFGMLLVAGTRRLYLAATAISATSLIVAAVVLGKLRLLRVMASFNSESYCHGIGWHLWQSLLAIGSGHSSDRLLGSSFLKYGFIPELQTSFVFARIWEETGLSGSCLVLLLYLGIFLCGLQIMRHARDLFGRFLAFGCTILIVLQAGIHIAGATGLITNRGLPLPFVSYGGSGLVAMFLCTGLLGSVAWQSTGREKFPAALSRPEPASLTGPR